MIGEVVAWWAALLGLWLLTLSSVNAPDLEVAVPSALVCAVTAVVARRQLGGDWRWPRPAVRWAASLPLALLTDAALVLALPFRRGGRNRTGEWQRVPVRPGADADATSVRGAATMLVSMTPGSFVVHDDADTGELLVHSLVASRYSMTDVVQR